MLWCDDSGVVWEHCVKKPLSGAWAIVKVSGHQYQWLAGGYDLEIGHF